MYRAEGRAPVLMQQLFLIRAGRSLQEGSVTLNHSHRGLPDGACHAIPGVCKSATIGLELHRVSLEPPRKMSAGIEGCANITLAPRINTGTSPSDGSRYGQAERSRCCQTGEQAVERAVHLPNVNALLRDVGSPAWKEQCVDEVRSNGQEARCDTAKEQLASQGQWPDLAGWKSRRNSGTLGRRPGASEDRGWYRGSKHRHGVPACSQRGRKI